jgi:rSAM/selenodomain-associated transferase 1
MNTPKIEILIPVLTSEEKLLPLLEFLMPRDLNISVAIGQPFLQGEGKEIPAEQAISLMTNLLSVDGAISKRTLTHELGEMLKRVRWVVTPQSRAKQLNFLAKQSPADFFWFLHADSMLEQDSLEKVFQFIHKYPQFIGYGNLRFAQDGPLLCKLNAFGANLRSRFFGMPFEDQSLLIPKSAFHLLGGYLTHLPYGEGHDLIWRAKAAGIGLKPLSTTVTTSARRYKSAGWLKTTCKFIYLSYKQAIPHFLKNFQYKAHSELAIAVFVKTPGLSLMKTRLAITIGTQAAETFQILAMAEIKHMLTQCPEFAQYWAVSEDDGLFFDEWKNLRTLPQGEGDLGDKIHRVYSTLQNKYGRAIIIGSDTPQITPSHLKEAREALRHVDFVIGPARDGGFWLFGGKTPISLETWQSIRWSHPQTRHDLLTKLSGSYRQLEILTDVDQVQDISLMIQEARHLQPEFLLFLKNVAFKVIS